MTTKSRIVSVEETKQSKNGNKYCQIILHNQPKPGIIFFEGDKCPVTVGSEYDFTIKEGINNTPIFNLKKENKSFARNYQPALDKDLKALELAVQLVASGKVEMKKIEACKVYLKSLM